MESGVCGAAVVRLRAGGLEVGLASMMVVCNGGLIGLAGRSGCRVQASTLNCSRERFQRRPGRTATGAHVHTNKQKPETTL